MQLQERIEALAALGNHLKTFSNVELTELAQKAQNYNSWFTVDNVLHALNGIRKFLDQKELEQLSDKYNIKNPDKVIGLILAGNIPLVGFHDLLCVLLSGNKALVKLSSKDEILPKFIFDQLKEVSPKLAGKVEVTERLKDFDAVIATGSNNTSRYFEYYFGKYPNIIRKNRSSLAVISGEESKEELEALTDDMLLYFGLGCRNVSKVMIPEGYDLEKLFIALNKYKDIINHNKYRNNYDYFKSIYLVNREPFLDTGFIMFKEEKALVSPVSVIFYQYYKSKEEVGEYLAENNENIQCVVASDKLEIKTAIPPGKAQFPEIDDFADRVDTMEFLVNL